MIKQRPTHKARRISNAKLVELDSDDHVPWLARPDVIVRELQSFLGDQPKARVSERVLVTVMFTDIVDSTQLAAGMGDVEWSDLLEGHHDAVRRELEIFRGHEVKTTGDGFHATFDGPARAVSQPKPYGRARKSEPSGGHLDARLPPYRCGMLITPASDGTSGISDSNTFSIPMGSGVAIDNHNG